MPTIEYGSFMPGIPPETKPIKSTCGQCKVKQLCKPEIYVELMRDNSKLVKVTGDKAGSDVCNLPLIV